MLRARFNDARFFWQTDQKHPLRERVEWLKNVTFQKDLGSYHEKTLRVQRLCSWLSEILEQSGTAGPPRRDSQSRVAAKDRPHHRTGERIHRTAGNRRRALRARCRNSIQGMPDATRQAIADAIYDQYKPESMEDSVPRTIEGAVLSIADKADSIAGMFALGLQPTGSKDPFALRRQANGIVKTIAEHKLPLQYRRNCSAMRARDISRVARRKEICRDRRFNCSVRDFLPRAAGVLSARVARLSVRRSKCSARCGLRRCGGRDRPRRSGAARFERRPNFESIAAAFKRIQKHPAAGCETRKLSQSLTNSQPCPKIPKKKSAGWLIPELQCAKVERSAAERELRAGVADDFHSCSRRSTAFSTR